MGIDVKYNNSTGGGPERLQGGITGPRPLVGPNGAPTAARGNAISAPFSREGLDQLRNIGPGAAGALDFVRKHAP